MIHRGLRMRRRAFSVVWVVTCMFTMAHIADAHADTNIDPVDKWAWSTNAGWVNFNPAHGGVMVTATHLQGFAWAENIGWISLGSYSGSAGHNYANTSPDSYGVNHDGAGNLSGYAWSPTVGWINFAPTHGGVTIDTNTGSFDGYAWSENVGWICFRGTGSVAYNVVARQIHGWPIPVLGNVGLVVLVALMVGLGWMVISRRRVVDI
jgi:hypothetical protein